MMNIADLRRLEEALRHVVDDRLVAGHEQEVIARFIVGDLQDMIAKLKRKLAKEIARLRND